MLFQTLYFFISIALFISTLMLICGMLFFRITSKSILGEKIDDRHPAFKNAKKFTSNLRITIACIFAACFGINVIFYTIFLIHKNSPDATVVLWAAPIVNVAFALFIFMDMRRKFNRTSGK